MRFKYLLSLENQMKFQKTIIFLTLSLFVAGAMACASCGCSLNTDLSSQGMGIDPGWIFDARYDFLNQNQLRSGSSPLSPASAVAVTNPKTGQLAEVEGFTKNKYLTTLLDYTNGETWGISTLLPLIQRDHMTYGSASAIGAGDGWPSGNNGYSSKATGLGDVRVIGRYFGFTEQKQWGLQFGLKLPTGKTDQTSSNGSAAVDPGLQLGTGSTDLIIGVYKFGRILRADDWGYYGNLQLQSAITTKNIPSNLAALETQGNYRPGDSFNLNFGLNYHGFEDWVPTIQVNLIDKKADSGGASDTWSTGGTLLYLTPGLLVDVSQMTQAYGNLQLPIYQNLNGIQLAPAWVASVGVRVHF